MWTMVYFRELPASLNEYSEDALDFFFEFANTYTEESILNGYLKQKKTESEKVDENLLHELGYSDEDTLNMNM